MPDCYSRIAGLGSYLPKKTVKNSELEKSVDTSDEWIVQRTGIRKRHLISGEEGTTSMAAAAGRRAFEANNIDPASVESIVFATTTPDLTFPSCASMLQEQLGCYNASAFDIQAACCGFVHALAVAHSMVVCGKYKRTLVVGSDSMSKLIDWQDRNTCVLFGDGAGCAILDASDSPGIIDFHLASDGRLKNKLFTSGGTASTGTAGTVQMDGKAIFQYAINKMQESISYLLKAQNLCIEQLDAIIPHQANIRIIESLAKKMNCNMDKMIVTVDQHANTSAASIPLAMDSAFREGKIKPGDLVIMTAIGAGLNWGSVLLKI